jgi:hypothetical protein
VLLVLLALATPSCRDAQVGTGGGSAPSELGWRDEGPPAPPAPSEDPPPACGTLRDVETADVLRSSDGLVLYANEQTGLAVFDVTSSAEPKLLSTSPFVGSPIAVFAHKGVAVVAFIDWEARFGKDRVPSTVLRAVDLADPRAPSKRGDVVLPGIARDVRRIGDVYYVTRDAAARDDEPEGATLVTSLVATTERGGRLVTRDEIVLPGRAASVAAAPSGITIARPAPKRLGPERTAVTWIDVTEEDPGKLHVRGTIAVAGVVSTVRGQVDSVLATDEDRVVRLYACARGCIPLEAAEVAVIDFAEADRPRQTGAFTIPEGTDAVSRFHGNRLFLAHPLDGGGTRLSVWRTTSAVSSEGSLRLDGTVAGIVARDAHIVTIGWTGTTGAGTKATIHVVDLSTARAPKLRGSVSFGRDWTWSPAYDDERALSFDPGASLAALPTTTLSSAGAYSAGAHVLSFGPSGPRVVSVVESERFHDRLLFAGGRLLGFGAEGVLTLRDRGPARMRSWHELEMTR